jgi:23S rRNA pseudouridine2605 synthase
LTVRLQKFLAEAGVASRRACEQIILSGRVSVNGEPVLELGTKVEPAADRVSLDGKPVHPKRKLHLALNKPRGCVCSRKDERGRPTIYDLLPKEWQNVQSVGRLDYDTEGLLFLANDGEFALRLTHPRYGVRKRYRVTAGGKVDAAMLQRFTQGVWHTGEKLKAERAWLISATKAQSVVELELAEGGGCLNRKGWRSSGSSARRLAR